MPYFRIFIALLFVACTTGKPGEVTDTSVDVGAEDCTDEVDNDGDGLADCDDSDCCDSTNYSYFFICGKSK